MPLFEVSHVSFCYPGFPDSLVDVSLSIERGTRTALLGANGSGKSTLLFLLNGLYFPRTGSVAYNGVTLSEAVLDSDAFGREFRKSVGFLFQNSDAQLFCPTVFDELCFGPLQLGMPKGEIRRRAEDTLRLLGLEALRDRSPQALSTGQKKTVALASLLTSAPSVLLLDEPTAGLDPRSQALLLDLLDALHESGTTLVTATHDLHILPEIADRAIVLGEDHRVAFDGPVSRVLADEAFLLRMNLMFRRGQSRAADGMPTTA